MSDDRILARKYGERAGFSEVNIYLYDRYFVLRDQYRSTRRYVSLHRGNRYAFSDEFASIMFGACAVFGSAMHRLLRVAGAPKERSDMKDYSTFLLDKIPNIQSYSVRVRSYFDQRRLAPFLGMTKESKLKWWSAYNDLKHDNQPSYRVGNLENCLNSLTAVQLLAHLAGQLLIDETFTHIDSTFDPADSYEELLFPPESHED